jgi:S-DNA-T family DNA segregation ATPase FtsK/SpoIIIE
MDQYLDIYANTVERVASEHGAPLQITGGQVLPHVVILHVGQLAPGVKVGRVNALHEEFALALRVPGVLIMRRPDGLSIEIPRVDAKSVTLGFFLGQAGAKGIRPEPHTALLGLGSDGRPLLLHIPAPEVAHVLIAGQTGSGKTELIKTMLVSLSHWSRSARDMQIYLVDPKGRKLSDLAGLRCVAGSCGVDDAPGLLALLLTKMEERDAGRYCLPRIYLVIDELADVIMVGGAEVEAALIRLIQRGREAGIHLICATQKPSARVVAGLMKANFPARIVGAVTSAQDAYIASGVSGTGAERLLGKGDMIVVCGGQVARFKAAIVTPAELAPFVAQSQGQTVEAPPAVGKGKIISLAEALGERLRIVRGPGRPATAPDEEMVSFAMAALREHGKCSQRSMRAWHQDKRGADVNPPRAQAAIDEAKRRLVDEGLALSV